MTDHVAALAIRKSVTVHVPIEIAFQVFTEGMGSWWPLSTKSVGLEEAETVVVEPRLGGRVYERTRSGRAHDWGQILVWEPPSRFAFSWHPGRAPDTAQEVEVRFTASADATEVALEHRGWEKLVGPGGQIPAHFESGWEEALESYVQATAKAA